MTYNLPMSNKPPKAPPIRIKPKHRPVDNGRRRAFLAALKVHGNITWAAREASPGVSPANAQRSFISLAKRDPRFQALMDAAREEAFAELEAIAIKRAKEGTPRAILHAGEATGNYEMVHDNRLLMWLLSNLNKTYARRQTVEHTGQVEHDHRHSVLTVDEINALSPDERRVMLTALQRVQASRNPDLALPSPIDADFEEV